MTSTLLTYEEALGQAGKNSALLLGNGFNASLGIKTDYKSIFEQMKTDYAGYQEIEHLFSDCDYDLEKVLGNLKESLRTKEGFLPKFIGNKIKLDFMKAASHLATSQISRVYQEKNKGIYILLNNFSNYFTLNYDPFIYLLLMKFKKEDSKKETVMFQQTLQFIEDDLDEEQNNIYTKIKEARTNGLLNIHVNKSDTQKSLSLCTKSTFTTVVKEHFKEENWTNANIEKAVNLVWKEENQEEELPINDGFLKLMGDAEPTYRSTDVDAVSQNLFFLHGAFHIYQNKDKILKITQKSEEALYDKLARIINNDEEEIICVFRSDGKKEEIHGNEYLHNGYQKLSQLTGSVVMIGCALSDNDSHIYEQINASQVNALFISSKEKSKDRDYKKAKELFPAKEIHLFDRETISYELPVVSRT